MRVFNLVRKQREDEVKLNCMYLGRDIETLAYLGKENIVESILFLIKNILIIS